VFILLLVRDFQIGTAVFRLLPHFITSMCVWHGDQYK